MKQQSISTNPFLVIRASVEAEIASPGVLTISSALPGDGKTAVAAGIAASLAAAGYRTLVLDASTRIEAAVDTVREPLGAELASERLAKAVRATGSGCDYLAIDDLEADVASAFAIRHLYAAMRAQYDYTVVDASVLNGTGLALSRGADGVVLAVREGRAIVAADSEAVELLTRLKAHFLGVVATTGTTEDTSSATLLERLAQRTPLPVAPPVGRPASVLPRLPIGATFDNLLSMVVPGRKTAVPVRSSTPE